MKPALAADETYRARLAREAGLAQTLHDRHLATQAQIVRPVDRPHTAAPEQLLEPEAGDLVPRARVGLDGHLPSSAEWHDNTTMSAIRLPGGYQLEEPIGEGAVGVVHRARGADAASSPSRS